MNGNDDELERAKKILDRRDERNDHLLHPTAHDATYGTEIPSLGQLLQTSDIGALAERFEELDKRANAYRDDYLAHAERANLLVFIAAVLGALTTASIAIGGPMLLTTPTGETATSEFANPIVLVFSILTAGVAGWSAYLLARLNSGNLLRKWMTTRAAAEEKRLEYFDVITSPAALLNPGVASPGPVDLRYHLVAFWYFLRHQLRVQRAYYQWRGMQHERDARTGYTVAAAAVAIGVVCSLLVPVLSFVLAEWAALFAVITVAGTALGGFAATREGIGQHRSNAERYQTTGGVLHDLERRCDEVEAAIRANRPEVLEEFVAVVNEQLSHEQKLWLKATEDSSAAVQRLNETLKSARSAEDDAV